MEEARAEGVLEVVEVEAAEAVEGQVRSRAVILAAVARRRLAAKLTTVPNRLMQRLVCGAPESS